MTEWSFAGFADGRAFQAPRVRACGWVAEWVACATSHIMTAPGIIATLITFDWEAGVAGRLLAQRFRFDLVHVPFEVVGRHALSANAPIGGSIEDLETSGSQQPWSRHRRDSEIF